jgi:HAAS
MSTTPDKLVERYLKHLEVELDDLPSDRRREIVDEIAGHIAEARAGLEHESEADVRNILEGLGDPADIAEEARERFEIQLPPTPVSDRPGWIEVGALVLLLVGAIVLPLVGWVIGVVLLWISNAWNVRDKWIGTLFWPGGLGFSLFLVVYGASQSLSHGPTSCQFSPVGIGQPASCIESSNSASFTDVLALVLMIVVVVTPIITTAYLAYRLRHHAAAATA